jgi:hypothetical protein
MAKDTSFPERFQRPEEFCAENRISTPTLYRYWRLDWGPKSTRIGKMRVIAREDAEAWRRAQQDS